MRTFILIASLLFTATLSADITGIWDTENNESQITISLDPESNTYRGVLTTISDTVGEPDEEKIDINNPDPDRRNDPLIGITLMQGFKKDSDKKLTGGTIYDPKSGKTYKCKITITDENTIKVRGYIGVSLVGRSTIWTRAK